MDMHVHISEQVHMWLGRPVNMMWCAIEVVFRIEWTVRPPVIQFQFKCAKHGKARKKGRQENLGLLCYPQFFSLLLVAFFLK